MSDDAPKECDSMLSPGLPAFGLVNVGATCWFNSLVQALISARPFIDAVRGVNVADPPNVAIAAFKAFLATPATEDAINAPRTVAPVLDAMGASRQQEDSIQGFDRLIDALGPGIEAVFKSRWRVDIYCDKCKKMVSAGTDTMIRLTVEREYETLAGKANDLPEFISGHMSQFSDYKCPKCGQAVAGMKVSRLIDAPPVLVLTYNKYMGKWRSGPRIAEMTVKYGPNGEHSRTYRLLAIIQHYGAMAGGHYRAAAARQGKVYVFDDAGVTPGGFETTLEDYVLVYG